MEESERGAVVGTFSAGVTNHINDESDTSAGARTLTGQLELALRVPPVVGQPESYRRSVLCFRDPGSQPRFEFSTNTKQDKSPSF